LLSERECVDQRDGFFGSRDTVRASVAGGELELGGWVDDDFLTLKRSSKDRAQGEDHVANRAWRRSLSDQPVSVVLQLVPR
jgi:hypothetical protein